MNIFIRLAFLLSILELFKVEILLEPTNLKTLSFTSISFFFLAVLGFELRASHLLGRCATQPQI
jgi:hypothetical protein